MYVDTSSLKCFGIVGVLNVIMIVLVSLLPPEWSLTVMSVMAETPWGFTSLSVSCSSQSTSWAHLITPLQVLSPVRAGCDWAASQVVQIVHYPTLDSRSNFQEMTISE